MGCLLCMLVCTVRAAELVISEFMADNTRTLRDEDGDYSDWIEIQNRSSSSVDLAGWRLTDDPRHRVGWTLPATALPAGGYLVVFASGKDRALPGKELHASFRLAAEGEYLALLAPDGSVATRFSPAYPPQFPDVAYGMGRRAMGASVLPFGSPVRAWVPADDRLGSRWTGGGPDEPFDDSPSAGWISGTTGVGFDNATGPDPMGPLGAWDFNDVANSPQVSDRSGRGNPGRLVGAAFTADQGGRSGLPGDRALDLENGQGRMIVPSAASGAFDAATRSNAISVSLWIRGGAAQPAQGSAFWFQENADGSGARAAQAHLPWSDSVIYWDTGRGGDCCSGAARMSKVEPDASRWKGRWNHYVFLKRGSAKEIWQNGALFARAEGSHPLARLRSLTVGAAVDGSMRYVGRIDDFAVWDRALDAREIGALAQGAAPSDLGGFSGLIGTRLDAVMPGRNASAYLRMPFVLPTLPAFDSLRLRIQYDAGFIAYLNGVEIARRNAGDAGWNASALSGRSRIEALGVAEIDLAGGAGLLRSGANVLAVHGLNESAADPSFLVRPELAGLELQADRYLPDPTPGAANGEGVLGFLGEPRFSATHGRVTQPFRLSISSPLPGATLVYTTNGSPPALTNGVVVPPPPAGGVAVAELPLDTTTVVRAGAFRPGFDPSPIATRTYVFPDRVARQPARPPGLPTQWADGSAADYEVDPDVVDRTLPGFGFTEALASLPILSVVAAPRDLWDRSTGIYANPTQRGDAWERPASVEMMFPDGTGGFQADCGIHIHGNISRQNDFTPKHSFRLVFSRRHGPAELRFPLFEEGVVDRFDELVLKGLSTDSWPCVEWGANGEGFVRWFRKDAAYVRDQWVRDAFADMGQVACRGRFVHLFLNGLYWGVFNLMEHPSAPFQAEHYGGKAEEYDAFKDFTELDSGTTDAWDAMMSLAGGGLSGNAAVQRLEGNHPDGTRNPAYPRLLNVENLIDYMILHIAIGADDWPNHNWWGARRQGPESEGFRFFPWDQEISNNSLQRTRTSWGGRYEEVDVAGTPTFLYARLRANADFRLRFADRVHRHLFNDGALTPAANEARWKRRTAEIDRALVAESARWGDAKRATPYRREVEWLAANRWMQDEFWPKNQAIALGRFRRVGLYPSVVAPAFHPHGGVLSPGTTIGISAPAGTVHWMTDGSDPRRPDGSLHPDALSATGPVTITLPETRRVRARVRSGGVWSAINEAWFTVPGSNPVIVSRLMYHPPPQTDAERARSGGVAYGADDHEFIELQNLGQVPIGLGGMSFTEGIRFTFPATPDATLAPLERLLIVRNRAAFENRHGKGFRIAGQYGDPTDPARDSQLSNAGERLVLVDAFRNPVFDFGYSDAWYPGTDGVGFALERWDAAADASQSGAWRPGMVWGGRPGAPTGRTPPPMISVAPGEMPRIRWEIPPGQALRLDRTETLTPPHWSPVEVRPMRAQPQILEIQVPSVEGSARFYRSVSP